MLFKSETEPLFRELGPVVQKVDSAIHRIHLYLLDNAIGFDLATYPLDSDLSDLQKTTGLSKKQIPQPCILTPSYLSRRLS